MANYFTELQYENMSNHLTQQEVATRIKSIYVENVILTSDYKNRREKITLKCLDCDHVWSATGQNVLYPLKVDSKHCPNCRSSKNGKIFHCKYCDKEIYRTQYQIVKNKSGFWYCSRECGNLHKNQLQEESGQWSNTSNYRKTAFKLYPHICSVCGWKEDERILEVHHIDENRKNNQGENLCILCPTCHRKITLKYYILQNHKLIRLDQSGSSPATQTNIIA